MRRITFTRPSFKSALLIGLTASLLCLATTTAPASTPATDTVNAAKSSPTQSQPIMLADEIIRRLRRLGLNFTKTRISHPYDPLGELC